MGSKFVASFSHLAEVVSSHRGAQGRPDMRVTAPIVLMRLIDVFRFAPSRCEGATREITRLNVFFGNPGIGLDGGK